MARAIKREPGLPSHPGSGRRRYSMVDLMKLLELDGTLSARKQLAAELHYGGDTKRESGFKQLD